MSRKTFEIIYQDGSKAHISRQERDDLVLSGQAEQIAPLRYQYTGQAMTFNSFADLGKLQLIKPSNLRRFLPGSFIIELNGKRRRELLETPENMTCRLDA